MSKSDDKTTMFAGAKAKQFDYARENRFTPTLAEDKLWEALRE